MTPPPNDSDLGTDGYCAPARVKGLGGWKAGGRAGGRGGGNKKSIELFISRLALQEVGWLDPISISIYYYFYFYFFIFFLSLYKKKKKKLFRVEF